MIVSFLKYPLTDKYSIDFISYLFSDDDKKMNPFIVILVERTPFDKNYRPILHRELEFFLNTFSGPDYESDKIGNDKISVYNNSTKVVNKVINENFKINDNDIKELYKNKNNINPKTIDNYKSTK